MAYSGDSVKDEPITACGVDPVLALEYNVSLVETSALVGLTNRLWWGSSTVLHRGWGSHRDSLDFKKVG